MPADHEARSLVKRRQLQETKGDAEASLKRKTRSRRNLNRGEAPTCRRESRVISTREGEVACESEKRGSCSSARNTQYMKQRDTDTFSQRSRRNTRIKYHTVVLDYGRVSQKVPSKSADQVVVNYRQPPAPQFPSGIGRGRSENNAVPGQGDGKDVVTKDEITTGGQRTYAITGHMKLDANMSEMSSSSSDTEPGPVRQARLQQVRDRISKLCDGDRKWCP